MYHSFHMRTRQRYSVEYLISSEASTECLVSEQIGRFDEGLPLVRVKNGTHSPYCLRLARMPYE